MDRRHRIAEIAMHVSAATLMLLAFLLLDLGALAVGAPESQNDTMVVSVMPLALVFLALLAEVVALTLRRRRL